MFVKYTNCRHNNSPKDTDNKHNHELPRLMHSNMLDYTPEMLTVYVTGAEKDNAVSHSSVINIKEEKRVLKGITMILLDARYRLQAIGFLSDEVIESGLDRGEMHDVQIKHHFGLSIFPAQTKTLSKMYNQSAVLVRMNSSFVSLMSALCNYTQVFE